MSDAEHTLYPSQAAFASDQNREGSPETQFRQRPDRTFLREFYGRRLRFPDGAEHEMTARSRRFANQLHGRFNLPVDLVDERYSSAVIQAKRGEVIDAKAAAIILQQYFDDHANN